MFKFKMSLLLQNVKFRVAVVVLLIAAILSGIIFIPRNKAGEVSEQVEIRALETGVKVAGHNVTTIEKMGKASGYNNLFCIQEEANLSYKVYSSPIDISKAGNYFTNFNCARWIINNMYITNITGANGLSNDQAQSIMAMNLANLLTTDTVKNKVSSYGFDVSGITPQKIYSIRKAQIGNTAKRNALETVEQIALWKYTKNAGNSISAAYRNNMNQYFDGANLTQDQQKTLKYVYYAFTAIADMKGNTTSSNTISNYVTLNKKNVKFDETKYQVGPYYLESNGFKLTTFNFGEFEKAEFPISVTITKNDGSTVQAGKEVVVKNNDGSFYINLDAYRDQVKNVSFKINNVVSNVTTKAYVLDGGDKQNLMGVDKSVGATSLTDSQDIVIKAPEGKYNVVLKKVKGDGTTVITSSEATFKVNGNEVKTTNGILNIANNKNIENTNQVDTYEIVETNAPEGFKKFDGTMKLNVKFKEENKTFVIDRDNTKTEGFTNGAKIDIAENNSTITVTVPNEELPKPGVYNVELYKVDENGNVITTPAKFEINGKEATTENGKIAVASNVTVNDDTTVGKYTIKETQAPENYKLFDGTITLSVKMSKVNNNYVLTKDGITFNVDGQNKNAKFTLDGSTIKVYVPNTHKVFDLSLRNYITEIDGVKVEPSREPIINEQSIKVLKETGTAAYYHIKDSIGVTVGSEVELTIRVYNEGEILGYAKEITDYLPEGLSFLRISEKSTSQYSTTSAVGSKVIVLNYNGNKEIQSLRDFFGKSEVNVTNDYYQEVKVICKVENSNAQYITSRSEITNYGYAEKDSQGNMVWKEAKAVGNVDIDSAQNTIKDSLNLDSWYENAKSTTYVDKNGKTLVYYPGTQDDDDFETVEVLSGKYNIVIKKVDSADGTTLAGAYFSVNGNTEVGPTAANGEVTLVKGVQIKNDKQVDEYSIKETKAPADYNLYNGEIKVKVATKFSGKTFVIDSEKTTVNGKDVKFSTNKENTTLTIVVPNTRKVFDLSLRKFITEVNGKELTTSREPKVDVSKLAKGESTTATYTHPKNPVDVNTTDVVTYTIRVYNEGELDGYATEIMDDIPEGLVFLPENEINKEYKWVMYKEVAQKTDKSVVFDGKNYEVTNNAKEAKIIVTKYLALENGNNNLIKAFNGTELNYKDIKAAFKVVEPTTSDRILINNAQITDDTDSTGKPVTDRDSTTNKWIDGEDDQDYDAVKVRYFDLALRKWVTKAIVYENGVEKVTETNHGPWGDPEPVVKVDLKNTNINNVKVKFQYSIRIYNQGEIAGYAKAISDYIPEGLKFDAVDNPQWKEVDGKIVTRALENTLLQPGEYADVTVILTWINGADNLGLKTNIAEISEDYNEWGTPDIDSTPNNKVPGEDDIDDAPVILAIRTGEPIVYTGVAVAALAIVSLGAVIIRKRILK